MAKSSTKKSDAEELDALAHHLAEALRIMGDLESIPARTYNSFANALNSLYNDCNDDELLHSEAHIRLYLERLAEKGGAK